MQSMSLPSNHRNAASAELPNGAQVVQNKPENAGGISTFAPDMGPQEALTGAKSREGIFGILSGTQGPFS
jgi:hypothetical protein